MKAMVIGKFFLVVLVLGVGLCAERPSEDEFNLFCRIFAETNDMMLEPDYIYDEGKDKEIVKEMQVLYNATTDNMEDFRKMLWETKEFFQEHPPPTHSESRKRAHNEIGNLIKEGEKKIEESLELAKQINKKIEGARLSVAQGMYGDHVTVVPKDDGNWTTVRGETSSIFGSVTSANESCGNGNEAAGKTLFNDFFCVCVGEGGDKNPQSPCSANIVPPKNGNKNCCKNNCCSKNNCCGTADCCKEKDCCNCCWSQMKYQSSGSDPLALTHSFEKIEGVCRDLLDEKKDTKKIPALLDEYVDMIGKGGAKQKHGAGGSNGGNGEWAHNNHICVDYTSHFKDGKTYNIPWHNKLKNYTNLMKQAKDLEDQILKNRAALLLLKSQAWVAYSREKDDETSNLDDMNASDKKDTMAENKQGEPKNQEREYIDVPSQSTQGSQPSQPAPGNADGRKYHYISSTEATQEEAPAAPAGGGEPPYIYVSSTGTPSQPTPAPETPSPTQQDPPTQSAKRLREENKTGE